ncbi:hypothetical protein [Rhodovulum steppense]|uniref:hypothetical protein n=1 Tax=Rhodovulum steppense TaxID=540251 RepID=UPI00140543C6|nr:hypothetical protein [Rhodovulum steppense]
MREATAGSRKRQKAKASICPGSFSGADLPITSFVAPQECPLSRVEAAKALGISVRYLFTLRKRLATEIEVCEWRGRRPVFYRTHIEAVRNALKCGNVMVPKANANSRSGGMVTGFSTSTSSVAVYEDALAFATGA